MVAARMFGLIAACGVAAMGLAGAAHAQSVPVVFAGVTPAAGNCPGIGYRLINTAGESQGYAWFRDFSGISKMSGTVDLKSGAINLTMHSLDGNGPTGIVTGTRSRNGALTATVKGPGCSNVKISRPRPEIESGDTK